MCNLINRHTHTHTYTYTAQCIMIPPWEDQCVCVFIKLHITAQSGPFILSLYATRIDPPKGGSIILIICLCVSALHVIPPKIQQFSIPNDKCLGYSIYRLYCTSRQVSFFVKLTTKKQTCLLVQKRYFARVLHVIARNRPISVQQLLLVGSKDRDNACSSTVPPCPFMNGHSLNDPAAHHSVFYRCKCPYLCQQVKRT